MGDLEYLTLFVEKYGYLAVFLAMFLEGLCIPVPSELIMGFAGFMIFQGKFSFAGAVLAGWLGSFTGSFTIYLIARKGGRKFLYRYGHLVGLTGRRLDRIADHFNRYGPLIIIPWRQLPVIRTKISIAAGLLDMRYIVFGTYTALGIGIWCTLAAWLGHYFGRNWHLLVDIFARLGAVIVVLIGIGALFCLAFVYYWWKKNREACQ